MSDVNQNAAATDEIDDEAVSLFAKMHESPDSKDSISDVDKQEQDKGDDASKPEGDDAASNSQGQAEEDPWATVPEALRKEHLATKQRAQQLESQFNASQHRLVPTQRELEAARKRLAELEAQQSSKDKGSGDMPTAADLKGKTFDELKAEWPEVAAALVDLQAQTQQQLQRELEPLKRKQEEREQKLQQEEEAKLIQSEFDRLRQIHPDAQEIALDPSFQQWLGNQPKGVQAMSASLSADDNAALLTLYKTATGKASKPAAPAKSSLSDHVAIPRQGAGRAAVDPNSIDPAELFVRLNANKK